ncbi:MAG: hypothetical protein AB7E32_04815 [Desulfovibrio sp.]
MNARRKLNLLAVPLMVILAAAVIDATVSRLLTSDTEYSALPGTSVQASGVLENPVLGGQTSSGPADAAYDPNTLLEASGDTQDLFFHFEEVVGIIWRARIDVSPQALPGLRVFWVHERLVPPGQEAESCALTVFADKSSYEASFHSLFRRLLGIKAWWVAAALLPVCVALLALSFVVSNREDAMLRSQGIGSIYKLARRGEEWEVVFGLGSNQGVRQGDRLALLDDNLDHVDFVQALEVRAEYSATLVSRALPIKHNFHIALIPGEEAATSDSGHTEPPLEG